MSSNLTKSDLSFNEEELMFINQAALFFEDPGLFAKSLNWVGRPIELAQSKLPVKARNAITRAAKLAIEKALALSIKTVPSVSESRTFSEATKVSKVSGIAHTGTAGVVGGIGGFIGLASLPIELPVATAIMLRSIADIAQKYGADLGSVDVRLECLYVFSLGGGSPKDDAMESAYYSSRILFAEMLKNASAYIAGSSAKEILSAIENNAAPAIVTLIAEIASQFEIRVTKKLLTQAAPIVGALGGAGINMLFANYFQECARFHFGLKRLEKDKGYEKTRLIFEEARQRQRAKLAG